MSESTRGGIRHAELLTIYCNDHLAASVGGIELVKRMIGAHRGSVYAGRLQQLLDELREEHDLLRGIMAELGLSIRRYKQAGLWVGEKLSRVKLNGRLLSRSPLSSLVEFEFLASAVRAKRSGFETLREVAAVDDRVDVEVIDRLIDQANEQHEWLTHARREVAADVFGGRPESADEAAGD
ncbi:hypothetical protein [Blastococcus saxobsidens]|uniref:Ferritin/DPS protein domain-containing protein n=1 Tax=Blastococcus saxobsidens TaxID=138336 RepID=A0A4Q7Y7R8_9ACTN|nr:hypothetical protein [Blastococcus saxobsidens]RZU32015.1 hypothetical protein BKA19_1701 [Blastococcus saxobsidens]